MLDRKVIELITKCGSPDHLLHEHHLFSKRYQGGSSLDFKRHPVNVVCSASSLQGLHANALETIAACGTNQTKLLWLTESKIQLRFQPARF